MERLSILKVITTHPRSDTVTGLSSLLFLVLLLSSGTGCSESAEWQEEMQYEIVRENVYDEHPRTQVDQWIAVSGNLSPENLRAFLRARYDSVMTSGGYTANQQPTNVYIYLFESKEAAERGGFGWLAMLEKRPDHAVSIRIDNSSR